MGGVFRLILPEMICTALISLDFERADYKKIIVVNKWLFLISPLLDLYGVVSKLQLCGIINVS